MLRFPVLVPLCLMLAAPACGPAPAADVPSSPSASPSAPPAPSAASTAGDPSQTPVGAEGTPPKAECDAFMDLIARTTALRARIQTMPSSAGAASEWANEAAELAGAAKKLDLTQPDLVVENAGLVTRLGDLVKDLRSLADAEKSTDSGKKGAAHARVLNTSEQVEVLTREPAARCGGDPRKLKATAGRLPPAKIQAVVRDHFAEYRKCYEDGLARDPKLAGRVSLRFEIDRDGKVSSAQNGDTGPIPADAIAPPGSDTLAPMPDPKVIECALAITRKLQFPKPDGGIVTVVYPIAFSPAP